jgi:transposase
VNEPVLDREVRWRLAVQCHVEEVTGNVAMTCRYFGISRPTYYTWLGRYEKEGVDGLRDRSKRPRTSPNTTRAEVVDKIIYLRTHYHLGPSKVAMYLRRYHDIEISKSGVWRILHRLDMGRLPASQRYKRHDRRWTRYERQRPGHHVQIDVKLVEPLPARSAGKAASAVPATKPAGQDVSATLRYSVTS